MPQSEVLVYIRVLSHRNFLGGLWESMSYDFEKAEKTVKWGKK